MALTAIFALLVALVGGAIALALTVIVRGDGSAARLALAFLLLVLAAALWLVGIQNPLPLP